MITEDYVSFETAKLLKEKGFNEICEMFYCKPHEGYMRNRKRNEWWNSDLREDMTCTCPTLQMAMKWLREEHNKTIIIGIRVTDPITGIIDCYYNGIYYVPKNNGGALCFTSPTPENGYLTYEEACEAGIKYALENFI